MKKPVEQPVVLIGGYHFTSIDSSLAHALPGVKIIRAEGDELFRCADSVHVIIPTMTSVGEELMKRSGRLRLVQQWGAGLEGVDIPNATRLGVCVANVPTRGTGNAESVAEWCVMAAVALGRGYPFVQEHVKQGGPWGIPCGMALAGKTAGIVGIGGIGQELAHRLKPFGMRLLGVKRNIRNFSGSQWGFDRVEEMDKLSGLLSESDVVFLCLPLRKETHLLIGEREFFLMKKGAFLVNPSRGGLIDRTALTKALQDHLGGVALDVFWEEPTMTGDSLYHHPRVLATPHIAGVTDLSYEGIACTVAQNIQCVMEGKLPYYLANKQVSPSWINAR